MTLPFGSEDVLIDLSDRAKLRLTGADRIRFLNGQVSNDMRQASTGASVYTCVMTIKGKMCADAFVHAGEDDLLVDTEPGLREALAARLERYIIADDVQLEDVSDDLHLFHLLPVASTGGAGGNLPRLGDLPGDPVDAGKMRVVQSIRYGRMGIDLLVPATLADDYRAVLAKDFRFLNPSETEFLRVAAGVPRWGAELGEDTMPAEAGLEARAVSYNKGCYIGQEVVSRVKSVGHVNWQLRGLRPVSGGALEPGMVLRDSTRPEGREVGSITSVSPPVGTFSRDDSPSSTVLALGYTRRGWEAAGTLLNVFPAPSEPTSSVPVAQVEVSTLPFST